MVKKGFIILLLLISARVFSQTGGDNVYEFLNLTHSGLVSSLGGSNVSLPAPDLNMAYHNPALLSAAMDKNLTISYVNYFAGINYGMSMYARSFPAAGNFAAGITYLNYGSFTESDESGNITGSFKAAEYAMSLIWSRPIDSLFTFGANLKPVLSHLERYTSFGLALDAGVSYLSRNRLFSAGLVLKNIGLQITTYTGDTREKLPFEIQAGLTQRLAHAPFRFSLTLRHLEKFDLTHTYDDNSVQSGTTASSASGFGENLLRHMVLGAEVIPHKNFYFSAGYNYQRRREMQIESKVAAVGFSWGFGINTSYLSLGFGRASYHLAGASNHITLIIRPDMLYRKFAR
jgi:hypothetical protein